MYYTVHLVQLYYTVDVESVSVCLLPKLWLLCVTYHRRIYCCLLVAKCVQVIRTLMNCTLQDFGCTEL